MHCLLAYPCYGQTTDLEFVKQVDPALYAKLLKIEQCRKKLGSVEQCKKDRPDSTTVMVKPAPPAAPAKPSNWWMSSAYDGAAPVKQWSHATQTDVSLNKMNGNIKGSQYTSQINYFNRYDALTNLLSIGYSKDKISQSDTLVSNRRNRFFNYGGRYDFNRTWFAQFGWIHEQDSILSIEDKTVRYFGAGAYLSDTPGRKLNLVVALGTQTDDFAAANVAATGQSEFDYKIAYAYEEFSWVIAKNLMFNQSFSIQSSLDDLAEFASIATAQCVDTLSATATYCVQGYDKPSQYKLTMGLEYQLNSFISLTYNLSFDHNNQPLLNDKSTNSSQNIGIRASFQ
jgi:hypothetical protein